MNDKLGWLIIGIIIAMLFQYARKHKSIENTKLQNNYSSDDQDIACNTQSIKKEANFNINQYKRDFEKKYSTDIELKKKLCEFAKTTKLDSALLAVWKEIGYYPKMCHREDFQKHNTLNVSDINNVLLPENKKKDYKKIHFMWDNTNFSISYYEDTFCLPDEIQRYAVISLHENEELKFEIEANIDNDYGYTDYCVKAIKAFKKKGSWQIFLINSREAIELKNQRMMIDAQYYKADEIRKNFQD